MEALTLLQERFAKAARDGEGLVLSPADVALLASQEALPDYEPEPPPGAPVVTPFREVEHLDNFNKVLARVAPSNPITIHSNDIASPIVWSLFVSWLKVWAKDGAWTFGNSSATVKHNGITHVIPYSEHPSLALDDSPRNPPPQIPNPHSDRR